MEPPARENLLAVDYEATGTPKRVFWLSFGHISSCVAFANVLLVIAFDLMGPVDGFVELALLLAGFGIITGFVGIVQKREIYISLLGICVSLGEAILLPVYFYR